MRASPGSGNATVVVLGSESAFSATVLSRLLEAGVEVKAFVALAAGRAPRPFEPPTRQIPVVLAGSGPAVAVERGVPLVHLTSMHDRAALEFVRELRADALLLACFPAIIDEPWLGLAPAMTLNVHPSLLPSYRGPTPLFWQFREGEHETGVSLHAVGAAVDAGDILAQEAVALPLGARFSAVNAELAERGAALAVDVLERARAGVAVPRTAQDHTLASYQPFPKETDFRFDTHFTAERAFRFMEGTCEWGMPYEVDVGPRVFALERALGYRHDLRMSVPYELEGARVRIRFSEGVLEAVGRIASDWAPGMSGAGTEGG